jgi:tyrosyl-tRNA synthetase
VEDLAVGKKEKIMFELFPPNSINPLAPSQSVPKLSIKLGIDPTAPSLHLGHLVPLRIANQLSNIGHDVTLVIGTFTAQMGDPSGKDRTRPILKQEEVESNGAILKQQLHRICPKAVIRENGEWFKSMAARELLHLMSKFTTAQLLARDAFQKRLENNNPIAAHELIVPLLQGWDSVVLRTEIEIGGTDQLFNFQITRQLQELYDQKPQICILTPIIVGTDGNKMSKSQNNCIFLDTPANEMFGKCMSVSDAVMDEWIPLLTDEYLNLKIGYPHPMARKKVMAANIVSQCWESDAAINAQVFFERQVQQGEIPKDIKTIEASNLIDAIMQIRADTSKGEARRLIEGGGIRINGVQIHGTMEVDLSSGMIIKVGKRDFGRIK